jgi:hypothetical protein
MTIEIRGAGEHNLQQVDLDVGDGLTVVTGISGSGKTSLVFDTLYHEARRRFLDIFSLRQRLTPADVRSITGLGPAVAVGQNLLNRNPNSILATASGLHPFLRLLYANFGERCCPDCGAALRVHTEDEIVEQVTALSASEERLTLKAPLLRGAVGSHRTLLQLLSEAFGPDALSVDGQRAAPRALDPGEPHDLDVQTAVYDGPVDAKMVRQALARGWALGAMSIIAETDGHTRTMARAPVCTCCGRWFGEIAPVQFHRPCPHCEGEGCEVCDGTGLHPEAAAVRWMGLRLPDLLALSVDDVMARFRQAALPSTADRLTHEITRRLAALQRVGLGYVGLDRPSLTLSRGASQRERDPLVAPVLDAQEPDGSWRRADLRWHGDRFRFTALALMRLGYLGFGPEHPAVARGAAYLFAQQQDDGSWSLPKSSREQEMREGYTMISLQAAIPLRALAMCGYATDPRAERAYGWLLDQRLEDGAWPTGIAGGGTYGYVAGYRKVPHSRWGCRSNTIGALLCLAYHPEWRRSAEARRALDLLLGRETREARALGFEVARLTGAEPTRGFMTFYARFDLAMILDLCRRIGATTDDPRVAELVHFVRGL